MLVFFLLLGHFVFTKGSASRVLQVIDYPEFRYVPYDSLDGSTIEAATLLGYTENTWNVPGTATIEVSSFETLTSDLQSAVTAIGYSSDQWECYVNHYEGYYWDELGEVEAVQNSFQTLGWTQAAWNGTADSPDSELSSWADLSDDERSALESICYFQEIWDQLDITTWATPSGPTVSPAPSPEPSSSAAPTPVGQTKAPSPPPTVSPSEAPLLPRFQTDRPIFRFVEWGVLDTATLESAMAMGYTEETWNVPGTAAFENLAFDDLSGFTRHAAESVGYNVSIWNCWVNHYGGFSWDDLASLGVQEFYKTLGWTDASWTGSAAPPASEDKFWRQLSQSEKLAAKEVCYDAGIWNQANLSSSNGDASTARILQMMAPIFLSFLGVASFSLP